MTKSLIAYVDGFNLYNGIHDAYSHRFLWLDLVRLMQELRPQHDVLRVSYFTAPLLDDPEAESRQATYWNALEAHNGDRIQIVKGRYQRSERSCHSCGATWIHREEKETDVNMALAIARDAIAKEATDYFLISGDSDAAPAIREAQRTNPGGFYKAYFPPKRHSDELKALMPLSEVIGRTKLRDSQLPATVVSAAGNVFEQPPKWAPETFLDDSGEARTVASTQPVTATPNDIRNYLHGRR